jgi:hypothetical protein
VNQVKRARDQRRADMTRCAFRAFNNVIQAARMVWNMFLSRVAHTPGRPGASARRPAGVHAKLRLSIGREWWKMRAPDDARRPQAVRIFSAPMNCTAAFKPP